MQNYVTTTPNKFQHSISSAPETFPRIHVKTLYNANIQYADDPDSYPRSQDKDIIIIHKILGTLLYFGIAINNKILPALSDLASEQSCDTRITTQKITKILNYLSTNRVAKLLYIYSRMILIIKIDTSYLSCSKSQICAGGINFLGESTINPQDPDILLNKTRV